MYVCVLYIYVYIIHTHIGKLKKFGRFKILQNSMEMCSFFQLPSFSLLPILSFPPLPSSPLPFSVFLLPEN